MERTRLGAYTTGIGETESSHAIRKAGQRSPAVPTRSGAIRGRDISNGGVVRLGCAWEAFGRGPVGRDGHKEDLRHLEIGQRGLVRKRPRSPGPRIDGGKQRCKPSRVARATAHNVSKLALGKTLKSG